MNEAKTAKFERAGWKLGTPKEFLELTEEESALIEIKLASCPRRDDSGGRARDREEFSGSGCVDHSLDETR